MDRQQSKKNIHIIGGAGGIGKWMQERIFHHCHDNCSLYCYDINKQALSLMPQNVEPCFVDREKSYAEHKANFQENDWIVFAVPLNHLKTTVKQINEYVKKGSLYISLTSTQNEAMSILGNLTPRHSSHIGCHPLFGPSISSPIAQVAALVDYDENNNKHKELKSCLSSTGLITSEITAEEHDGNMSVIQALTHFTYLTFAHTLSSNGFNPKSLLRTTTPNFQFLYAFASRIIKISPTTTGAIQNTREAEKLRKAFINASECLHDKFSSSLTVKDSADVIEEIRHPFKADDVSEGVEIAAMAVDSLQRIEELFYRYKENAYPFVFRSKTTGKIHVVKIVSIAKDTIKYVESTKRVNQNGTEYFAIGLDSVSRNNYKRIGLNIQKPYEESIKKRNIVLLPAGELDRFKRSRILPASFQLSVANPYKYDEDYFERWLPLLVEGVWNVQYRESYRRRGELERVSIDITHNPDTSMELIRKRIKKVIEDRVIEDKETNKSLQRTLASSRRLV